MSDALNYTRASKIRRFGPLASAANRNLQRGPAGKTADEPRSPYLAPEIQRSLLHVGMRVRKSISTGYKTHKAEELMDNARAAQGPTERQWHWATAGAQQSLVSKADVSGTPSYSEPSRKRALVDEEVAPQAAQEPRSSDLQSYFASTPMPTSRRHVRTFAVPKTRRPFILPDAMDVDPKYVDANGDFGEADFLVPE